MRYRVSAKITNCDSKLGHPQAKDQSFSCSNDFTSVNIEGARALAKLKYQEMYPKCTVEIESCEECGLADGGCNIFDPADLKKQDFTERARE